MLFNEKSKGKFSNRAEGFTPCLKAAKVAQLTSAKNLNGLCLPLSS